MKKLKSLYSIFLILSIISTNVVIFPLSVFALEKGDFYFEKDESNSLSRIKEKTYSITEKFSARETVDKQLGARGSEEKTKNLENFKQKGKEKKNYVEGEVLVKYKKNKINLETFLGRAAAERFSHSKSMEKKEDLRRINVSVLKIKDNKTVEEKIAELKNDPNVEYAEPNYKRYPAVIDSNDTYKNLLWGLDNTGQEVGGITGTNDADIDAPEAWTISEGSSDIIVAVVDSGIAYNHPDLADNMWNGDTCLDENGNILGGCKYGYDYKDNDKIPLPTNSSHGTHITGTIGAVKNNNKGIIGVAPNVKIMAIKFALDIITEVKAIDFAINNGAKIINASFGGASFSQAEYDAIERFQQAGGVFVVAAGNESADNDGGTHFYPSDYDLDNIISVAAMDQNDNLTSWSSYGAISVDVGAPGTNIYSTVADSNVLYETFENIVPPNIPSGWTKTDYWGTYDLGVAGWDNVLYGDLNMPYVPTANSVITSSIYDLTDTSGAAIDFWAKCDTEYNTDFWTDYMALEISGDGTNFTELERWDEAILDIYNGDPFDDSFGAIYHFQNITITSQYFTSAFQFRLRWVANGNTDTGGGDGCLVDDIKITKYSDGSDEQYAYGYMQGTSMATPHVAGLAGLIWGYKPGLTYSEVKNVILDTGDPLTSLNNKTVTGKRINAYNALESLIDTTAPVITLSGTDPVNLYVDDSYTDAGATALDDVDGDITGNIVTINPVDTSTVGTYIITYNVSDATGNSADEVTRTVNVFFASVTLNSLEITHPADKLSYFVDESLDLTGLEVTGIYSDASTKVETITEANMTGFDSSAPVTGQVLTITVDGKTATYTVDIVATLSSAKAITAFSFATPVATGVVTEGTHTIAVTVPFGTALTALTPTITLSGGTVSPLSGVTQDFTSPVTYTVTAADASTQAYSVTVTVATNTVSGNITEDTTWTLVNSPYIVTGTVQVLEGVTLTVEPGVTAKFNKSTGLIIDGEIYAIGDINNLITFTTNEPNPNKFYKVPQDWYWGGIHIAKNAVGATFDINNNYLAGNIIKYSIIEYAGIGLSDIDNSPLFIDNNIIRYNNWGINSYDKSIISNNVIDGNASYGIKINGGSPIIHHNQITNNSVEASFYPDFDVWGMAAITFSSGGGKVYNNFIKDNARGFSFSFSSNPEIKYNNIYNNQSRNFLMQQGTDIQAKYNYLGSTDKSTINLQIIDYYDNVGLGKVNYEPYATAELDFNDRTAPTLSVVTPISTPTNDNTPSYIFSSTEAGTITYGGSCSSATAIAVVGNNAITFNILADGTYNNCTITVIDAVGNSSTALNVSTFTVDTIPPVITLIGSSTINLYVGDTYTELGHTAIDDIDGDITGSVIVGGDTVNTSAAGTYTITYNVSDAAGNPADGVTRTVNVSVAPDTTPPVITLTGDNPQIIEGGSAYTELGATALDDVDEAVAVTINASTVDTSEVGTYTVTYTAADVAGNTATANRTVNVVDTIAPSITAPADITTEATGVNTLVDLGAPIILDIVDTNPAVTNNVPINGFPIGITTVTWTATDASENSTTATQNVKIIDTTAPIITGTPVDITEEVVSGESGVIVDYTVPTAADLVDGSIVVNCLPSSGSMFLLGDTIVTCTVTDTAGNTVTSTFKVIVVVDTTAPIITLLGDNPITIEVGTTYNDAGATANDNYDGNITGSMVIENSVNSNTIGVYTVIYNVMDSSGNPAQEATRTVNVVDTTPPVITLLGENPINIPVNTIYNDAGATANDNHDGVITDNIVMVNPVDTNTLGTYYVTYNVSDAVLNTAAQVTRTVNVVDLSIPVISLSGDNPVTIEVGLVYSDAGATAIDDVDGDISGNIVVVNNVNSNILGTYTVNYNVSDSSGNHAPEAIRTVNVVDTAAPVIVLLGDNPVSVEVGYEYNDAGATSNDNYDGDITDSIVTVNPVDYNTVGTYVVTYNVTDSSGNSADEVTRTVDIVATLSSAKAITVFSFATPVAIGVINETTNTIAVNVPFGTNVTALIPTITINGVSVSSDTGIAQDFTNPVIYIVTAVDTSTQSYIVTVTIVALSNIVTVSSATYTISALEDGAGTITNVLFGTSKATFETALTKGQVDQTWNDTEITDPVVTGNTLVVTAQDGITTATYIVTVNAEPSHDAILSNLTISPGTLSPAFLSDTKDYTDSVNNSVTSVTVTPIANQTNAIVTVNGNTVVSGLTSDQIALNVGSNTILIVVTAQDGITTDTYTITITRAVLVVSSGGGGGGGGSYTPSPVFEKGDINKDNKVDKYDFSMMMAAWDKTGSNASDLNRDNKVDKYDFALLMSNWSTL